MKYQWLIPVALMVMASAFAGCLGGGSDGGSAPEYDVKMDEMHLTGGQPGLAQAQPVDLNLVVPIGLDFDNVIKITINITVEDGDEGTEPDQVGEMILTQTGDESNNSVTVNGGNTPVIQQMVLEWDGVEYLGTEWVLDLSVTINGGQDQWPGPFIWRGIPDQGFTYILDVSYDFHDMGETL